MKSRLKSLFHPAAWIDGLMATYVAVLLAWVIFRSILGDRSGFVLLINYLALWAFFPLILFGPWSLFRWHKIRAALLVAPLALLLCFYGPLFIPPAAPPVDANPANSITVLTYNLNYFNQDVEGLWAAIREVQADVLALQELSEQQMAYLDGRLGQRYPHCFYDPLSFQAVYSRYPIVARKTIPLVPWPAQSAVIQVNDTPFLLINAHLARLGFFPFLKTLDTRYMTDAARLREAQIAQILEVVDAAGLPAVVACDCNMTEWMDSHAHITEQLQDAHLAGGWGLGLTFIIPRGFEIPSPVNLLAQRLDYVFASPEFRVVRARVLSDDGGSDHLPFLAQLVLPGE